MKTNVPQGAFYLFPNVSYYFGKTDGQTIIKSSSDLCFYLLDKAHVALVSGEVFGHPACVRLSYAIDKASIVTAIERVKKALEILR